MEGGRKELWVSVVAQPVKLQPVMLTSQTSTGLRLGCSISDPVFCEAGKVTEEAQMLRSLPPTLEIQTEFQSSECNLVQPWSMRSFRE